MSTSYSREHSRAPIFVRGNIEEAVSGHLEARVKARVRIKMRVQGES